LVCGQSVLLLLEPFLYRRFQIGLSIAFSSVALLSGTCARIACLTILESDTRGQSQLIEVILIAQLLVAIWTILASLQLKRRPDVFANGRAVDDQYTTSAFRRYSTWDLLLGFNHWLPCLDIPSPGRNLCSILLNFESFKLRILSSWTIGPDHATCNTGSSSWAVRWIGRCGVSFSKITGRISFGNGSWQVWRVLPWSSLNSALQNILELLQVRGSIPSEDYKIWWWIAVLGISKATHAGLEAWWEQLVITFGVPRNNSDRSRVGWISTGRVALPIRSQLSALIFTKSLYVESRSVPALPDGPRSKTPMKKSIHKMETDPLLPRVNDPAPSSICPAGATSQADKKQTSAKQEVVNLLGVDAARVSDFAGYSKDIPGTILKITLSVWYLASLLGWRKWASYQSAVRPDWR